MTKETIKETYHHIFGVHEKFQRKSWKTNWERNSCKLS